MKFKEFSEFDNPERQDYDINRVSVEKRNDELNQMIENDYDEQLIDLIGIVEDIDEEDFENVYGITVEEYNHPTAETIRKVKEKLANNKPKTM